MNHKIPLQKSGIILPEPAICHGCGICELACSLYHEGSCAPTLSRIHVYRDPLAGIFRQEICKQCLCPECYFVCPVNAIVIDEKTGARKIVENKCIGCYKCANSCPINKESLVLRYNPIKKIFLKCDLCSERDNGPLCVEICPWKALRYVPANKR